MYQALLERVADEARSYGEALQPPCASGDLEKLRSSAVRELGHPLPDAYATLLTVANGLDWNGLVVYASERSAIVGYTDRFIEGFIEGNLHFRDFEPLKGLFDLFVTTALFFSATESVLVSSKSSRELD